MGTRNLTIVRLDGKIKVAQYCQWDGYPTGQGSDIAKYLHSKSFDLSKLKKKVSELTWASKKEIKETWIEAGASPHSDEVTFDIADKHTKLYPEFSRDTGADILRLIQKGKVKKLDNRYSFLKDGLFCEYAYALNLNTKKVTVYVSGKKYKVIDFKDFTVKAMKILEKEIYEGRM